MASFKRLIVEEGLVISKFEKKPTDAFTSKEGKFVEAQPRKFMVQVASAAKVDKEFGMVDAALLEFKVDETFFTQLKPLMRVKTEFEYSGSGLKPISISLNG